MIGSHSGYDEVCRNTGMRRHTTVRGPFTFRRVEETPLSKVIVESGYRDSNHHDWMYVHGGGRELADGIFKGAGEGLGMPTVVESSETATTIRLLIAYADTNTVEVWLDRVLDPELSQHLYFNDVLNHTNKQEFLSWLQVREQLFEDDRLYERQR